MKFIKLFFIATLLVSFSSCVKEKNNLAGMLNDEGNIVTAIMEQQYLTGDANNLGFHYHIYAGFNHASPATETVRFFTLHISQPRTKKVSGNLVVKIGMSAPTAAGYSPVPAGAINIPSEISIPAQEGTSFDFPVRFTVNKALLTGGPYGATFTITSVNQGVASSLEKTVEVLFLDSRYDARYKVTTTVTDANDAFEIDHDTKTSVELYDESPTRLVHYDFYLGSYGILVANKATGAATALFNPSYQIDPATGKLTGVFNRTTGANVSATIDPSSGFTYTANDNRTFIAKYTVTLTVGGVARLFTIDQKFEWVAPQAL